MVNDNQRVIISIALFLTLFGVVVWCAKFLAPRLTVAMLGPKQWRDLEAWEERIEELLQQHTRSCLRLAVIETELASMVKDMPAGFIHPIKRGIQFGYAYDVALRRKAVELGLFEETIFKGEPNENNQTPV